MSTTSAATDTHRDREQLRDRTEVTDLIYRLGVCFDEGRFVELRQLLVEPRDSGGSRTVPGVRVKEDM
jgi:hypothetical protein